MPEKLQENLIIVEDMESAFGRIRIYESSKDGSYTYYQDSCFHSRADSEGQSLVGYVHAMYGVLMQAQAHKIAVLGCAGGTLATMLAKQGCDVTTVDINPYSFELAKRYFCLPDEVECVVDDARDFLQKTTQRFDGIALDVFDGGEIPMHFRTVEFFRLAASRLTGKGVMVANAIIDHDLDLFADNVAASMREGTGLPVVMLDDMHEPDRNIVIVAGEMPAITLPSGSEPSAIQQELRKMIVREVRRQSVVSYDK